MARVESESTIELWPIQIHANENAKRANREPDGWDRPLCTVQEQGPSFGLCFQMRKENCSLVGVLEGSHAFGRRS